MPFMPTLSMDYGRGGDFDNFVQTDGVVLDDEVDGVSFATPIIAQRGDCEADGDLDVFDIVETRVTIQNNGYSVWCDCEGDDDVDVFDIVCLRTQL
jgi:hypothetical protein